MFYPAKIAKNGTSRINAVCADGVYDWNGTEFQQALQYDKGVKVIDFNNDGRNDFLDSKSSLLFSYSPSGEFSRTPVKFLTPQEYYD